MSPRRSSGCREGIDVKCPWIAQHRDEFPVRAMCQTLGIGKSRFYEWQSPASSPMQQRRDDLTASIRKSFEESHQVYGYRKVYKDLIAWNIRCCPETVRRVMKHNGWISRVKRSFRHVSTTDPKHDDPIAPNTLNRDFTVTRPNEKWLTDITYVPTREGWLYLAAVEDTFRRMIVG